YKIVQEALKEESQKVSKLMVNNSPSNTGKFREQWDEKLYPNSAYVYNGPLTNIIEHSKRGPKPFIQNTFDKNRSDILNSLINRIKNKIRRKK
ncbi:MAG: hypothetical protein PF487_13450, partial [Bacteroidales bacterium]|nr:hypothetical protein [Bacteroidales bacterium]